MKAKHFLLVLSLCTGLVATLRAQTDVTINPIGLLFGDLNVGADFILNESFSIEGNLGLGGGTEEAFSLKWNSLPITTYGKYYFAPKLGADRFYASAFLRYVSRNYTADGDTDYAELTQSRFGAGFGIGLKTASAKGIIFDIGFGAGRAFINNTNYKSTDGIQEDIDWPEVMFTGKLALGYRFGGK